MLQQLKPDLIISSLALRAQITADELAKKIGYKNRIHYMEELYNAPLETLMNVISLQDDSHHTIYLVGHNPTVTELANYLANENFYKMPAMGVLAIDLDIDSWSEIDEKCGTISFFIEPKQFRYYMPKTLRMKLPKKEESIE